MSDAPFPIDSSTLTDRVYSAILEQLINHRFQPGQKLSEEAIASHLNVSRTPVREALQRLAADGLVEVFPRCGANARDITPRDITELYDLRRCLEIHAAKRALVNIPPDRMERIESLIRACHRAEGADFIPAELELDREIHRAISDCCGNSRLAAMLEKLGHLAAFMRILHYDRAELARENLAEHEGIWAAVAGGDEKRMVLLLEEHLNNRENRLLEHVHQRNADRKRPPL